MPWSAIGQISANITPENPYITIKPANPYFLGKRHLVQNKELVILWARIYIPG
jgi:hypothetical protein